MFRSGEMAQQFGALTALAEDGFDSQHPHEGFTALRNSHSRSPRHTLQLSTGTCMHINSWRHIHISEA